jgi:hypothetical protein
VSSAEISMRSTKKRVGEKPGPCNPLAWWSRGDLNP